MKNPDNRRITRQTPHRKEPGVQAGSGEKDKGIPHREALEDNRSRTE